MKTIMLVALLAAAGCSKKSSDCDASISKGVSTLAETIKSRTTGPQQEANLAIIDKLKGTLIKHCNEDKWPAEVASCFTTVTNQRDMRACQDKLSTDQKTKLSTEIQQIMLGSMRMPPGTGHPSTLSGSGTPGTDPGSPAGSAAPPPTAPPAAAPAAPPAGSAAAAPPAAAAGSAGSGGW
jgi:hypothetical protein